MSERETRTDADLLRLIAADHQRLAPNSYHSAETLRQIAARIEKLGTELAWYGEQARLARLIHSEGDAGRHALQADGGKRANAAIAAGTSA